MELTVDSNEFNKLLKEIVQQRNAIQRVRELHKPIIYDGRFTDYERCSHCYSEAEPLGNIYPCPTIKALDGEQ